MTAKSAAKRYLRSATATFVAAYLALAFGVSVAGPTGESVVSGEARVTRPDQVTTNIDQLTDLVIIDWSTFNVASDEVVNFIQPSSDAAALNRILDQNPSEIFGQINANGRLLLVNPYGFVFGRNASVDVGSLFVSGLDISNDSFLSGDWQFNNTDGSVGGLIINHGLLQAANGGSINLFGGGVVNDGAILADFGTVNIGVGEQVTIDFDGDGLIQFAVDGEVLENAYGLDSAIANSGEIAARGGSILLSASAARDVFSQVVNNEGVIAAQGVEDVEGRVYLVGEGGVVANSGVIDASNDSGNGGTIQVLGDQVALVGDAVLDASGSAGGGDIRVGGGIQGGEGLQEASHAYVGSDVVINVDATQDGDGGSAVVWSSDGTRFYGSISGRGAGSGDGGFAEVSGGGLVFQGLVDMSAENGEFGVLLLDPDDIVIAAGTGDGDDSGGGSGTLDDPTILFGDTPTTYTVYESELESVSAGTSIILQAVNSITTSGGAFTVTLTAGTDITLETTSNTGAGINIADMTLVTTETADIVLIAGSDGGAGTATVTVGTLSTAPGTGALNTGNISITADSDITVNGALTTGSIADTQDQDSGDITLTSTGGAITIGGGASLTTGDVDVTSNNNQALSGTISLTADGNIDISGALTTGDTSANDDVADSGAISITSNNGTVTTNAGGTLTTGAADGDDTLNTDSGGITIAGANGVTIGDAVTTGNASNTGNNVAVNSGAVTISSSAGNVAIDAAVATGTATSADDQGISGAINVTSTTGTISSSAGGTIATGAVDGDDQASTSGSVTLTASTGIALGDAVSTGTATLDANSVAATSGDITISTTTGNISGTSLATGASTPTSGGGAAISGDIDVDATAGAITFTGTVSSGSATSAQDASTSGLVDLLAGGGDITVASVVSGNATSSTGDVQATSGSVTLAASGAIALSGAVGSGSATSADLDAVTGNVSLTASGGSISGAGTVSSGDALGDGNGTTEIATSGNVTLDASGNITLSAADAVATGNASLDDDAGTNDTATIGSISLVSDGLISSDGATGRLDVSVGTGSLTNADGAIVDGSLTLDLSGGTDSAYVTSGENLAVADIDTGAGAQTVDITTSGTANLTIEDMTDSISGDTVSFATVDGTLTINDTAFAIGAGSLSLEGAEVDLLGGANSITGSGAVTIFQSTVAQDMTIGGATDDAALNLTSTDIAALADGFASITLGRADGTGLVSTDSGGVSFADPLTIQSGGASGDVIVGGTLTGTGDATIDLLAGNEIALSGDIVTSGTAVTLDATTVDLDVAAISIDTTNAGGTATGAAINFNSGLLTDVLGAASSLTLNAGTTGQVDLNGGSIGGDLTVDADIINLNNATLSVGGNADLDTSAGTGTIADNGSGALSVAGTTTLAVGAAVDLVLDSTSNDFDNDDNGGAVSVTSGNNITLVDADNIDLGAITAGTSLTVTAAGNITDSGTVIAPTATFDAGGTTEGTNDVLLDSAANDFDSIVITQAGDAVIVDVDEISFGASTISGDLDVTAADTISQSGALVVTLTSAFTTTNDDQAISLGNTGNSFGGAVSFTTATSGGNAGNVTVDAGLGGIEFGASTIAGNLSVIANNGSVTQSGALDVIGTAGFVLSNNNTVTLVTAGNDIDGTVSFSTDGTGANVSFTNTDGDASGTTIGASTVDGSLTIVAGDALVVGGALDTSADNGVITLTGGTSVTIAEDGLQAGAGNISVTASGGNIEDASAGADTNANITTTGQIALTASGSIGTGADPADLDLSGTTDLVLSAGTDIFISNDVELTNFALTWTPSTSTFSLSGATTISLSDDGTDTTLTTASNTALDLDFSLTTTSGDLLVADGAINTIGAGNVSLTAQAGSILDSTPGADGAVAVTTTGTLALDAANNIGTSAGVGAFDVDVSGLVSLTSGGDIFLDTSSNLTLTAIQTAVGANTLNLSADTAGAQILLGGSSASYINVSDDVLDIDGGTGDVTFNVTGGLVVGSVDIDTGGNVNLDANLSTADSVDGASGDINILTSGGSLVSGGTATLATGNADDSNSGDGGGITSGSIVVNVSGTIDNSVTFATGTPTDSTGGANDTVTAGSISLTASSIGSAGNAVELNFGQPTGGSGQVPGVLTLETTGGAGAGSIYVTSTSAADFEVGNITVAGTGNVISLNSDNSGISLPTTGDFLGAGISTADLVITTGAGGAIIYDRTSAHTFNSVTINSGDFLTINQDITSTGLIDIDAAGLVTLNSALATTASTTGTTAAINITTTAGGNLTGAAGSITTGDADNSGGGTNVTAGDITLNIAGTVDNTISFTAGDATDTGANTATAGSISVTAASIGSAGNEVIFSTGTASSFGGSAASGVLDIATTGGAGAGGAFVDGNGVQLLIGDLSTASNTNANEFNFINAGAAIQFVAGSVYGNLGALTLDVDTTGAGGNVVFNEAITVGTLEINTGDTVFFLANTGTADNATASGNITIVSGGGVSGNASLFTGDSSGGTSGSIDITASGSIADTLALNVGAASTTGGDINLDANGIGTDAANALDVVFGTAGTAGQLNLTTNGSSVFITSPSDLVVGDITATGTETVSIGSTAGGAISFDSLGSDTSIGNILLDVNTAGGGTVTFDRAMTVGVIDVDATGEVIVNAALATTTGALGTSGDINITTTGAGGLSGTAGSLTTGSASNGGGGTNVTAGSITVSVVGDITNGVSFTTGDALDTAALYTATSGSINLDAANIGGLGTEVAVTIGTASGGAVNDQGELNIALSGAGTAEAYVSSSSSLEVGTIDTVLAQADTVSVLVTGGNTLTLTAALDEDFTPSLTDDNLIFNAQDGTYDGTGIAVDLGAAGSLSVTSDGLSAGSFASVEEAGGGISVSPFTAGTTIGLGTGAGTFQLSDADLDALVTASGGPGGVLSVGTAGAGGSGDVTIDDVTFGTGQTLIVNTNGTINDDDDIGFAYVGGQLVLNAGTGIGTTSNLQIDTDIFGATVSTSGGIDIETSENINLGNPTQGVGVTAPGDINITVNGNGVSFALFANLTLESTAGNVTIVALDNDETGPGDNLTPQNFQLAGNIIAAGNVTISAADDISLIVGSITAGGTVTLNANVGDAVGDNEGSIFGSPLISGAVIDLNAYDGIGVGTALNLAGASISADTTTGAIDFNNNATGLGTVTLSSVTTASGAITIDQTGGENLILTSVDTNSGNIAVTNDADILVALVDAVGSVTLNAGGAIEESGADAGADIVASGGADLDAATGIGAAATLETAVAGNYRIDSLAGAIDISNNGGGGNVLAEANTDSANITFVETSATSALIFGGSTTTSGNITVQASDALVLGNEFAVSGIGFDTSVNSAGNVTATSTADFVLLEDVTAAGTVTVTASAGISDWFAGSTTVSITAPTVIMTTDTGGIGTISGTDLYIVADSISATVNTSGNIDILSNNATNTTLASVSTVLGTVVVDQSGGGDLVATSVSANNSVTLTSTAGITVGSISSTGATDTDDIILSANSIDLAGGSISAAGLGDVSLTATAGSIDDSVGGGSITADDLSYSATTTVGATNAINTTVAEILSGSAAGGTTINETDAIVLTSVSDSAGAISLTAGGAITATSVSTSGATDTDDIALQGTSIDLAGGTVSAAGLGDVSLTATAGSIDDSIGGGSVVADDLSYSTTTTVGATNAINTNVAEILSGSAAGGTTINETDAIVLTSVSDSGGAISITAGGAITATSVSTTGAGDTDDIALQGTSIDLAGGTVSAAGLGDVSLTATAGSVDDSVGGGSVVADDLSYSATTTVGATNAINTTVAEILSGSAAGGTTINETDAIVLTSVSDSGGAISITAGGAITATSVSATGGTDTDDVTLVSTGAGIAVGNVAASGLGDISIDAQGGAITDSTSAVSGDNLTLTATTGIGASGNEINTTVNSLTASVSGAGDIFINETNGITLTSLSTFDGSISVAAAGVVDATSLTAGDDDGSADESVTINTSGNIHVGLISTGTTGSISLTTSGGSIYDQQDDEIDDLVTSDLTLSAITGNIGGSDPTPAGGPDPEDQLEVNANGTLTLSSNSLFIDDNSGSDVTLDFTGINFEYSASGNILVGFINASGTVLLETSAGYIRDDGADAVDIAGSSITLNASLDVGDSAALFTQTDTLAVTAGGNIDLDNNFTTLVTVSDLTTTSGTIDFDQTGAGGASITNIDATDTVTLSSATTLQTGTVDVTGTGNLSITADGITLGGVTNVAGDVTLLSSAALQINGALTANSLDADSTTTTSITAGITTTDLLDVNATTSVSLANVTLQTGGADTADILISGSSIDLAGADLNAGASGDVVLTATAGSIVDTFGGNSIVADDFSYSATGGVGAGTALNLTVVELLSGVSAGTTNLVETNDLIITSASNSGGTLNISAGGALVIGSVTNTTGTDAGDITLSGTSIDLNGGTISASGAGDVSLLATAGAIDDTAGGGSVVADDLSYSATTTVGATNAINTTVVEILSGSANGGTTLVETDAITLTSVSDAGGAIDITAGDAMSIVSINAGANAVTLNAGSTITDASGGLTGIVAGLLTADAAGGMTLDTNVTSADLSTSAAGNIVVTEVDAIILTDVDSNDGAITVTAGGAVTATDVASLTDNAANDIAITGSTIAVGLVDAGATGDVTLNATGGAITDAGVGVTANVLTADAAGAITLDTTVTSLDLSTSAVGDITINETDAVTVTSADTATAGSGAINITSGGAMNIVSVNAGTSAVTLNAGAAITDGSGGGTGIIGGVLTADAAGAMTLDTQVTSVDLSTSATGDIIVTELDAITLTDVDSNDGAINVTAGGAMTVTDVASLTDNDANDITLQAATMNVVLVDAGAAGDVFLTTTGGAITDGSGGSTGITADVLTASAAGNLTVDTAVNTIVGSTSAAGGIVVTEVDGVELQLTAFNGATSVTAGGAITATSVVSSTDSDANDIALTSTGAGIAVGTVNAGAQGDVFLDAQSGAITDATSAITTDVLTMSAAGAIGTSGARINSTATSLVLTTSAAGDVWLNETNGITLTSVATFDGSVDLLAAGIVDVISLSAGDDDGSADETVTMSTSGDITIGVITTGGTGLVDLTSTAGSIFDRDLDLVDDIITGDVSLSAVTGSIGGAGVELELNATGTITLVSNSVTIIDNTGNEVTLDFTGGNFSYTSVGNILVGFIDATGAVDLTTSNGWIRDDGADAVDIAASSVTLSASLDVGSGAALATTATTFDVTAGNGAIDIDNSSAGAVTVTSLSAVGNTIDFDQVGGGDVAFNALTGSAITLSGANGVTVGATTATGALTVSGASIIQSGAWNVAGLDLDSSGAITLGNAIVSSAAITIDSTGSTSLSAAADISSNGAVTFGGTLTGGVTTAADITTQGDAITFTRAVTLSGAVNLDTTNGAAAGANVSFGSTVNGANALTINAGTAGDVSFSGDVGGSTPLGATSITADQVTISGAFNTAAASNLVIANGGLLTLANAATLNLGGAFQQTGAGLVDIGSDITTSGDAISFASALTLTDNVVIDTTTTANITFGGAVDGAGFNLSLDAGSNTGVIASNGTVDGVGTYTVVAGSSDINADMGTSTAIGSFSFGGPVDLASGVDLTASNGLTFNGGVVLSGGGTSVITGGNDAAISFASTITSASGSLTVSSDGDLTFTTINTGTGSVDLQVDSAGDTNFSTLSGTSVTAAGVSLRGGADNNDHINLATVNSAGNVLIANNVVLDAALAVTTSSGGNITATGNLSGGQAVTLNAAGAIDLQGNVTQTSLSLVSAAAVTLGGTTTTTGTGTVDIDNGGLLTIGGAMNLNGAFTQTGAGNVSLGGDITTTGDAVSFVSDVTLTGGARSVSTGTGAGDILFAGAVSGNNDTFTLTSGTGRIGLADVTSVTTLDLNGTGMTLSGGLTVDTLDVTGMSGGLLVQGAAAITTANTEVNLRSFGGINAQTAGSLSVDAGTANVLLPRVGNTTALDSLDVTGTGIALVNVTTTGAQGYNGNVGLNGDLAAGGALDISGNVVLLGASSISGATVDIGGDVDGGFALVLDGDASVGGAVGAATPLTSLTTSGTAASFGGTVTTTGAQTYGSAATFNGDLTGSSLVFDSTVSIASATAMLSDVIDFNGGANSVSGSAELTLVAATDGASIDIGTGSSSATLSLNAAALSGFDSGLVIGGYVTGFDIAETPRAQTITISDSIDVGTGTLTLVARDLITLVNGTVSGNQLNLVLTEQQGQILNTGGNNTLLSGNLIALVAGGGIGEQGEDIFAQGTGAGAQLQIASNATGVTIENIGNSLEVIFDSTATVAFGFAEALRITTNQDLTVTSSAQSSANREQGGGLADEGFIDPSLFEDISLYEVLGSGIAMPADQSEEETFETDDCDPLEGECNEPGGVQGPY
ncbi:MAG: filamentous hemagglutinin N-terminal domain-containing protein [Gammaproteobacteria bacterium]|nr:filamentous hemagglutinin N-terminal domain-containing protein [Gammaproteobacteria bacterium]